MREHGAYGSHCAALLDSRSATAPFPADRVEADRPRPASPLRSRDPILARRADRIAGCGEIPSPSQPVTVRITVAAISGTRLADDARWSGPRREPLSRLRQAELSRRARREPHVRYVGRTVPSDRDVRESRCSVWSSTSIDLSLFQLPKDRAGPGGRAAFDRRGHRSDA